MAEPISILKGTKAELVFTHDSSQASDVLFAQWQISVSDLVGAAAPKSFFNKFPTTTEFPASPDPIVIAQIAVVIATASGGNANFNILEILATFGFTNNNDGEVDPVFFIRDSVSGILSTTKLSTTGFLSAAGSSVFRGTFSPGLHIFTLEMVSPVGGTISIAGGVDGSTALYIQQMNA